MTASDRYEVRLTTQAVKDLKRLRPWTDHALQAASVLEDDPYRGHGLSGSLRGVRSLAFTLKGSGAYRAIYRILEDEPVCLVFLIASHENVYREAERRAAALRTGGDRTALADASVEDSSEEVS